MSMGGEGQAILTAEQLCISFDDKIILDNIDVSVTAGEFIGIIGPNGAGKSTLLRGLRGLQPLRAGDVKVQGRPLASFSEKQLAQRIAYMQQDINVAFGFTALALVLAGRYPYLSWWQGEQAEDYRIARQCMEFTGVSHLAEQAVDRVSGGERQRILLAKVLAQQTPLIFLDEPTASLDLNYQEEIFRYCRALCDEGKTVLLVVHDIKLAAKFCSRLLLLADGGIVADGAPENVITAAHLEAAYGLQSAVFVNKVTGHLDIHTYCAAATRRPAGEHVHVIGGGGSAGPILRALYEHGYHVSVGILQVGDTDADVAAAFHMEHLTVPAFCAIDAQAAGRSRAGIAAAHYTVLTNLCYGQQNLDNLEAAFAATKLIVIEDTPIAERDFTGGQAAALYERLVALPHVAVMTTTAFMESLHE